VVIWNHPRVRPFSASQLTLKRPEKAKFLFPFLFVSRNFQAADWTASRNAHGILRELWEWFRCAPGWRAHVLERLPSTELPSARQEALRAAAAGLRACRAPTTRTNPETAPRPVLGPRGERIDIKSLIA
jgi:hypothetical protein